MSSFFFIAQRPILRLNLDLLLVLGFRLLPAAGELLLEGLLFFLLDRLGGKLLERLSHHIHIPAFEEDEIARRLLRGVLLEARSRSRTCSLFARKT